MSLLKEPFSSPRIQFGLALLALVGALLCLTRVLALGGFWGGYALPALLWVLLALGIRYYFPAVRPASRARHRRLFCWLGFICGLVGVLVLAAGGLIEGFGLSPYDHSLLGMGINLLYVGSLLVGMEYARAWLVNGLFRPKPGWGIALTAIIFTFFSFPLRRLAGLETPLEGVEFFGGTMLPALLEHGLASYLAVLAGPVPAIVYRGVLLAFQWFSPVLPDLHWTTMALVGTFAPVFGMVLVYEVNRSEVLRLRRRDKEGIGSWVAASAVSVLLIWFAVGVFSVFPNVIVTGSMSPQIEVGDVVIVHRVDPEEAASELQPGDVIQFQEQEHVRVTHRVVEVREDYDGQRLFITQGDANENPDSDPVLPEQVVGRVSRVVPKIGWVTVWLRGSG